jgi:hypothetical protein
VLDILAAAAEEHAEATALGMNAGGWVAIAMLVVFGVMLLAGVPRIVAGILDSRIEGIRKQLDEARTLRAEAEKLRDEYATKAREADAEVAVLRASCSTSPTSTTLAPRFSASEMTLSICRVPIIPASSITSTSLGDSSWRRCPHWCSRLAMVREAMPEPCSRFSAAMPDSAAPCTRYPARSQPSRATPSSADLPVPA